MMLIHKNSTTFLFSELTKMFRRRQVHQQQWVPFKIRRISSIKYTEKEESDAAKINSFHTDLNEVIPFF